MKSSHQRKDLAVVSGLDSWRSLISHQHDTTQTTLRAFSPNEWEGCRSGGGSYAIQPGLPGPQT